MHGCMHGLEIIIANTIQYIKHTKYHAKHFISLFLLSQLPFHCSQSLTTYLDIRFLKKKKNSMTHYFKHMQKQREELTNSDSASIILTNLSSLHLVSLALLYYFEANSKQHIISCGNVYRAWDSLVVQWLRVCLAMQGIQFQFPLGKLGFHMPQGSWAHPPQLLSPHTATRELVHRSKGFHMIQLRAK